MSALFQLLSAPFLCLTVEREELELKVIMSLELTTEADVESTNAIGMRKDSIAEASWPPKKHKEPFVAAMAEYWDMKIAELETAKEETMPIAIPEILQCRSVIFEGGFTGAVEV